MKKILFLSFFVLFSCTFQPQKIKTELYFGLNDAVTSRNLTPKEWQTFVEQQIVPRFPQGFTILDSCTGYWLSESLGTISEECKVFIKIHFASQEEEAKIQDIVKNYKTQFHQEGVLRTDSLIKAELL